MKLELTVGVYRGDDLVDLSSHVVSADSLSRCFLAMLLNDSVDVSVNIKTLKELDK